MNDLQLCGAEVRTHPDDGCLLNALMTALESCITSEGAACFGDMRGHPEWMQRRLYAVSDIARAAIAKVKEI